MTTPTAAESNSPIRVLHVVSGDLWAGAEVQVFTLCLELATRKNVDVHVAVMNEGQLSTRLSDAGIEVTVLDESKLSAWQTLRSLARIVRASQPDVVHTHRHRENVLGAFAARFGRGAPSVRTVHGSDEHSRGNLKRAIVSRVDRFVARRLQSNIVAVSRELQRKLTHTLSRSIDFVPNGVDMALFDVYRAAVNPGKKSIAFVGRLVPVKRIDLFIEVARQTVTSHPDQFAFSIFGDGPERTYAEQLIRKYGLENDITLHGFVSDMIPHLAQQDALLITSDHEGLPMVVLEAASLGTPIISRRVGEISAVVDGANGATIIDSSDARDYVAAVAAIDLNPDAIQQKVQHARQHVRQHYSVKQCADGYLNIYRTAIAET